MVAFFSNNARFFTGHTLRFVFVANGIELTKGLFVGMCTAGIEWRAIELKLWSTASESVRTFSAMVEAALTQQQQQQPVRTSSISVHLVANCPATIGPILNSLVNWVHSSSPQQQSHRTISIDVCQTNDASFAKNAEQFIHQISTVCSLRKHSTCIVKIHLSAFQKPYLPPPTRLSHDLGCKTRQTFQWYNIFK